MQAICHVSVAWSVVCRMSQSHARSKQFDGLGDGHFPPGHFPGRFPSAFCILGHPPYV